MEKAKAMASALLAAVVVPPIAFILYFSSFVLIAAFAGSTNGTELKVGAAIFLYALAISAAHVILLGLPSVWLLEKLDRLNLLTVLVVGFVAGCLPMGVWSWPVEYGNYKSSFSYWNGGEMVQAKVDGVPTLVGWIDYSQGVVFMGALGVIGALSFWWVWKHLGPNKSLQPTQEPRG